MNRYTVISVIKTPSGNGDAPKTDIYEATTEEVLKNLDIMKTSSNPIGENDLTAILSQIAGSETQVVFFCKNSELLKFLENLKTLEKIKITRKAKIPEARKAK